MVVAGDHGIVAKGVSAYPQKVTGQMLANFAAGGAAICVLAREVGARLVVVDAGVNTDFRHEAILDRRLGPGTGDASTGPAMARDQAVRALEIGIDLATGLASEGVDLIGLGDIGIGNTAASAALAASLLGRDRWKCAVAAPGWTMMAFATRWRWSGGLWR